MKELDTHLRDEDKDLICIDPKRPTLRLSKVRILPPRRPFIPVCESGEAHGQESIP